ncbi:MAG: high-potential iron-sulfur protein [Steroidobacteraceae bacterium]|jgi:hypothetical protein
MKETLSRRTLVSGAFYAAALIPALGVIGSSQAAAALTPLDPNDGQAKAFAFTNDTTKVDAAANPSHKAEQSCANCAQFVAAAGAATGGCNLFPGKSVPKNGWCKAWVKKPGT